MRSYLFPSVLATTVDPRGVRWIGREAFPFGCIGGGTLTKPTITYNLSNPKRSTFKYNVDLLRGNSPGEVTWRSRSALTGR